MKRTLDEFCQSKSSKLNRESPTKPSTAKTNQKIKLPDAIILASAKYANADLLTDDWDDFQNIDSGVIVKDLDDLKI